MKSNTIDVAQLAEAVHSLRREVARLSERMAALEKLLPDQARQVKPQPESRPKPEALTEEVVLAISAAIAAYLGVKPHIRQIRLLDGAPWAQQGRVTIQASHVLAVHHG